MERQLLLHHLIKEELRKVKCLYEDFSRFTKTAPDGSLSMKNESIYRSCIYKGKQCMIKLQQSDNDLLQKLKLKRYAVKGLPKLKNRIKLYEKYLEYDEFYDPEEIQKSLSAQYHGLIDLDIFLEGDVNIEHWREKKDKQGRFYLHNKKHLSANGYKMRSKSEALIGLRLEENSIDFKYEPLLKLGNRTFAPDFEILLPTRRILIYWEHFGMLDSPVYVLNMLKKLEEYAKHGIILGYNLIITYETSDNPLTIHEIDMKIKEILKMDKIYQ